MAKTLRLTAATIGSLFVVAFQLQLLPFFSPLLVNDRLIWPAVYYGCGALAVGFTLVILVSQRSILRRSLPVLAVCAFAAGLTLIYPLDTISKNLIVAMIFVACATVLAIASAPFALLRFSASVTVLSAVVCLLDILFSHGFTNSVGRAAGLSINANVAAAGLLLGAAASYWTVARPLRSPFLLIVGAAILVTLSKSTGLAAIIICTGIGADLVWTRVRSPGPNSRIRWFRSCVLALGLAGWVVAALFSNDRFSVAATDSIRGMDTAFKTFGEALQSINSAIVSRKSPPSNTSPVSDDVESKAPPAADVPPVNEEVESKSKSDDLIMEIGRRAENEGDTNSISARGLLMERAFLVYRAGPFFGQGLAAAHALHPHNTFLLFAVAFGDLGWLAPIAFLGLTVYWVRSIRQLPIFLATLTVMATSHDILFTPGLLVPIVFGIAALNALRYRAVDAPCAIPPLRYTALVAPILFALGGVSIAGNGTSTVPVAPKLLLLLVFGAITLWSIGVWRWDVKSVRQRASALPRGEGWD
jgi:O-Antigen ligase